MFKTLQDTYAQKFDGLVTSCYEFELAKSRSTDVRYQIKLLKKYGNCFLMNNVFEFSKKLWVHKVAPQEIFDYVSYVIGTSVGHVSWLPIVLETNTFAHPCGIVKPVVEHDDVILFRIIEKNSFEVYVIKGKSYDSINYLQLLTDGHLEEAIQKVKLR